MLEMSSKGILQFDLKIGHPYRSHSTGPEEKKHFHNKEHLEWLHNKSSFTCSGAKLLSSTHLHLQISSTESRDGKARIPYSSAGNLNPIYHP